MNTSQRSALLIGGIFAALIIAAVIVLQRNPASLALPLSTSSSSTITGDASLEQIRVQLPVLADRMPEFSGISKWWNTPDSKALTPADLKGKVVLIDFWTYSCINCIRTQPVLRAWWNAYEKDGLVIIGVHTPEFAFEKDAKNVGEAIKKAGLKFPIALDADYGTWNNYNNQYWPAEYVFDREGRLRHTHFGEGNYDETEKVLRALLSEGATLTSGETKVDSSPDFSKIQTAETYFGLSRQDAFVSPNGDASSAEKNYITGATLESVGDWTVNGTWKFEDERAIVTKAPAGFQMKVKANAMHIVLGSDSGDKRVRVLIDGKDPNELQMTSDEKKSANGQVIFTVNEKRLYRIAQFADMNVHTVELQILDPGVEFYAATFGQ